MPGWPPGDVTEMTLIQKGEILYLDSVGQNKKQIAGTTNRSMNWIEDIISALAGTKAREDLITEYKKELKKNGKK